MKLVYFTLCLFLVWTQATPIDKLRQHAARAAAASQGAATTSFVEKETIEMEKTDNKRSDITEADEVADLMKTEAENAAAASSSQNTNENRDVQDGTFSNAGFSSAEEEAHNAAMLSHQASAADNTDVVAAPADSASSSSLSATTPSSPSTSSPSDATTTPTSSPAAALAEKASSKTDAKKPMEWQDAVLVDDLTIERATADANTRFIGANMKTTKVGKAKEATQGPSFLQFGPPAYYIHPAFLQQHEAEAATRAQAGAQTQGWGDYGTPLYYARDFGSFDGLGAGGVNMYGAAYPGYYPYTSGLDPTTQGVPPYYSPYGAYGTFSPPAPPPPPFDLPLPPYIKQVPAA